MSGALAMMLPMVQGSGSSYTGGALDTQTVTTAGDGTAVSGNRRRGFISSALGSINDGTSNVYAGAAITELAAEEQGVGAGWIIYLKITGTLANSGWTSINIGGSNVLQRSLATFVQSGGITTWSWSSSSPLFSGIIKVGFD